MHAKHHIVWNVLLQIKEKNYKANKYRKIDTDRVAHIAHSTIIILPLYFSDLKRVSDMENNQTCEPFLTKNVGILDTNNES